jgi:mRNA-degrading endonuclease toxin of MazEF toxin-antitoxin module
MSNLIPSRGQIWNANLTPGAHRHWVLIVSLDSRNRSEKNGTVLIVPFSSRGKSGPSSLEFPAGETGLPGTSYLKCYYITTLSKEQLIEPLPRAMSNRRMKEVCEAIRRSFDPNADAPNSHA